MAKKAKPNKAAAKKPGKKSGAAPDKTAPAKSSKLPKVIGDLSSNTPEARAIYKNRTYYKNHDANLKKQKIYDAKYAEKKRLEFQAYYDKKYPPPKD